MRKIIVGFFLCCAACTDAGNTSIEIPFDVLASDESSSSATGVCTIAPVTQSGGLYKGSGTLELDPYLNPNAQYTLELQVENYLSQVAVDDSNGNVVVGANENDFHMEKATIKYLDIEGNLTGPSSDVALISGVVRTGGLQGATAVSVPAVTINETLPWINRFSTSPNLSTSGGFTEDVVLEVQIFGVLSSGEQATSGLFHFPLQVCFGCENLSLGDGGPATGNQAVPYCEKGTTPIAFGHGPCCAPQDFFVACVPCGAAGGACCGGPPSGSCDTGECTGAEATGIEICNSIPGNLTESLTCPTS